MIFSEAAAEGKQIRVTVFNEWEDVIYEGVPVMRVHMMYMDDGDEKHRVEIIGIESAF